MLAAQRQFELHADRIRSRFQRRADAGIDQRRLGASARPLRHLFHSLRQRLEVQGIEQALLRFHHGGQRGEGACGRGGKRGQAVYGEAQDELLVREDGDASGQTEPPAGHVRGRHSALPAARTGRDRRHVPAGRGFHHGMGEEQDDTERAEGEGSFPLRRHRFSSSGRNRDPGRARRGRLPSGSVEARKHVSARQVPAPEDLYRGRGRQAHRALRGVARIVPSSRHMG